MFLVSRKSILLSRNKVNSFIIFTFLLISTISIATLRDSSTQVASNQVQNDMSETIQPDHAKKISQRVNGFSGGFIQNNKITSEEVQFFIQSKNTAVAFGRSSLKFTVGSESNGNLVNLNFLGSNPVDPTGVNILDIKNHYFIGSDQSQWTTNSYYTSLVYKNIYNHIDLHYLLEDGHLKYEFYVYPGGNVDNINLEWSGSLALKSTSKGIEVNIKSELNDQTFTLLDSIPINYESQLRNKEVKGTFKMLQENIYGFEIPEYNKEKLLIIDPTILDFSTYVSGSNEDKINGMVLDASDNIYVTGYTKSIDFPTTPGANDTTQNSTYDAFILKLSPDGTTLLFSTYIGGTSNDWGKSLVVDSSGNVYLTGYTLSSNFPVTTGVYDETYNGGVGDVFALKLSADGSSIIFATYIGGSTDDEGFSIALDPSNNVYITGLTDSSNFPTTVDANDTTVDTTNGDAFVLKLKNDGTSLIYSTIVGGASWENVYAIKVDNSGYAYITGYTYSNDFPTTDGANDRVLTSYTDGFLTKVSTDGTNLVFSTYISIGGSTEDAHDLAIDTSGNVYITGNYYTSNHMVIFVVKLSADGSTKLNIKTMSATGNSYGRAITLDNSGDIYVAGFTEGNDFTTTSNAYNTTFSGGYDDAVIFKLTADMSQLNYSTYLGGNQTDEPVSISVNSLGNIITAGFTSSTNFPVTSGAFNETGDNSTGYDGFITSIVLDYDNAGPTITGSATYSCEYGTTGNTIFWSVEDPNPDYYFVTLDGQLYGNPSIPWVNGTVSANVDNLNPGAYVFELNIFDTDGNSNTFIVTVTVTDSSPPLIDSPSDFSYEQGTTGNVITWNLEDPYGDTYVVYKNGSIYANGTFSGSASIPISVDDITEGIYNFTIYANDTTNNFVVDTVYVIVSIGPIISSPADISFLYGSTDNVITWNLDDPNGDIYVVYKNGSIYANGSFSNSQNIPIGIDNLPEGIYNFTIFANDTFANFAVDTVIVTVLSPVVGDIQSPTLNTPTDISYTVGSTGNQIQWAVSDQNPFEYYVTLNGSTFVSNTPWENGTITVNIDNLEVGTYLITIYVSDANSNTATDSVVVHVLDNSSDTNPTQSNPDTNTNSQDTTDTSQQLGFLDFNSEILIFGLIMTGCVRNRRKR